MRWFSIRKATIDSDFRETFEQYGVATMQAILATTNYFQHKNTRLMAQDVLLELLPWLTEQYDRAERKETWLITMEAAITIFVGFDFVLATISFFCRHST
ncbi:MAG: hypothetical protein WCC97_18640 [Candidatus Acidiferrales bacterium]